MADLLTYAQIYEYIRQYLIAHQDVVTDFNPNSALDTQIRAFSEMLAQAYTKMSGAFKNQFASIPFLFFDFDRIPEQKATSTVVFSRAVAEATVVTIPIGTVVASVSGNLYTTTASGEIASGNTNSGSIAIQANIAGSSQNGTVGSVTIITSSVPGANTVTNNIAVSGGRDVETNAEYYTRFSEYILGLQKSNPYGIKSIALQVTGVQSVYVKNHFPPVSGYNYTIYIDDGSGATPQALLDDVILAVGGNDTEEYQGGNDAGINFRVLGASLVSVNYVIELDVDPVTGDEDLVNTQVTEGIITYMNNLTIGRDVLYTDIIKLMKNIANVYDVNSLTLNGSSVNVSVAENEIARAGTIAITFSTSHPR